MRQEKADSNMIKADLLGQPSSISHGKQKQPLWKPSVARARQVYAQKNQSIKKIKKKNRVDFAGSRNSWFQKRLFKSFPVPILKVTQISSAIG